jgi:hypothetical protein
MTKSLWILLLTFLITFTGCSSYSITKYFDKDEFYLNSLQYTKKADIIENDEVISIFTATYLNKVDDKYDDNYENFIVSVYVANNKKTGTPVITLDKQSYSEEEEKEEISYEKNYLQIEKVEKVSKMIESIPLKNAWATYYLIKLDKSKDIETPLLRYKLNENQMAEISF